MSDNYRNPVPDDDFEDVVPVRAASVGASPAAGDPGTAAPSRKSAAETEDDFVTIAPSRKSAEEAADDFEAVVPSRKAPAEAEDDFEAVAPHNASAVKAADDFEAVAPSRKTAVDTADDFEAVVPSQRARAEEKAPAEAEDDFETVTPSGKSAADAGDDFETVVPARKPSRQPDNAMGRYLDHLDASETSDDFEDVPAPGSNSVADEIRARAAMGDEAYARSRRRASGQERTADRKASGAGSARERGTDRRGRGGRSERAGRADRSARDRYDSPYSSGSSGRRGGGGAGKIILVLLLLLLVAAGGIAGVYGFTRMKEHKEKVAFYEEHFLPYTVINGIDCTDKTPQEIKQLLESQVDGYKMTLKTLESDEMITGDEADLRLNLSVNLEDILAAQNHEDYKRTEEQSQQESVGSAVEINEDKLRELVKSLPEFQKMTETQDAAAEFDEETGMYVLREPVTGTKVDVNAVADRVVEAVKSLSDSVDLKEEGFYKEPQPVTQEKIGRAHV